MSGTEPSSPAQQDPGMAVSGYSQDELNPSDGDACKWKDKGYAWVVCGAVFLVNFFMVGTHQSYGVLFPAFLREFEASRATAAWAGSLAYGLLLLGGPFGGTMCKTYGPRKVAVAGSFLCFLGLLLTSIVEAFPVIFFTYGVLFGIGSSLAYSPGNIVITWYFEKHRTLATGIAAAGGSFGTLALTPLLQAMENSLGWRGAIRYFLVWQAVVGFAALAYRPLPPGSQPTQLQTFKTSPAKKYVLDLSLWRNEVFVVWTAAISLTMYGYYIPYVHLPSYAADLGVTDGSVLVLMLGAASAGSRLLLGPLLQVLVRLNRLHIQTFSMIVTAVVTLVLPACSTFGGLVTCVILLGLFDGCFVTLLPILTVDLVGVENMSLAWGFTLGSCSVSFILGPPTAGWIRTSAQSYEPAFYVAGTIVMLGGLLLFAIPWAKRRNTQRNNTSSSTSLHFSTLNNSGVTPPLNPDTNEGGVPTMAKTSNQECACAVPLAASRSIVDASVLDYVMKLEEAHIYAEEYARMGNQQQGYELPTITSREDLTIFQRREGDTSLDVPGDVTEQTFEETSEGMISTDAKESENAEPSTTTTTSFPISMDLAHTFVPLQHQFDVTFSSESSPQHSVSTTSSLCSASARLSPAFVAGNPFLHESNQLEPEPALLPCSITPPSVADSFSAATTSTTTNTLIDMSPYTNADVTGTAAAKAPLSETHVIVQPDTPAVFGDTSCDQLESVRKVKSDTQCLSETLQLPADTQQRASSESSGSDLAVQPQPGPILPPPPPRVHRLSEGASSLDSISLIGPDWVIVPNQALEVSSAQQQSTATSNDGTQSTTQE